ncbi:unnamed protein product [Effrenium voratum]|uniref:Uncharacterized protein n=1 Tax=Effrenium voratum TaxID=2562239 RepID=A0AA36J0N4_9DINO|nr:unnamed protein product [Effrenium voratum]
MAAGTTWGIGGWIAQADGIFFCFKDIYKGRLGTLVDIGEACLLLMACQLCPSAATGVVLTMGCDNTGAEAGLNSLFTTKWPLPRILQRATHHAMLHQVHLQVYHTGEHNIWADDLSTRQNLRKPLVGE